MKPYYEDSHVTIYHGDCREILPKLVDVGCIISDPPYGLRPINGTGYGRNRTRIAGDEGVSATDWLMRFWGDRPAVLFGLWQRAPDGPEPVRQLVWSKTQLGLSGSALPWRNSHEVAWVYGEGWSAADRGTVWTTAREQRPIHPTQKPVDLMEWIVECAGSHWVIADPFMGSGTTLVAAKNLDRKAIGIELEEKWCEIAANRCAQGVLNLETDR